ncbi:alpha-1,3/4-fucosidase [Polaribacter sp. ALD11]|uniref:alpha-L-fucosidase n=1 Tax=Polaribacter sp. ALD11 TaxID=2058137 RepID=UPI000C310251|nr:alpha-L-fucosidase [Polaribacter sp. ALD11]AUC85987.1 alpha-1,3/4-fucosidase [Polaribacter sp. ALD11]
MKTIILCLLTVLTISSCSQSNGVLIETSNTFKISSTNSKDSIILKAAHVVPTKNQYEALKNEFIAFIHFGPNTFTRMEWGNGKENPSIFNLQNLDTDQWCKAMKAANMKMVIFTVKHHDGFVLWQSRYTKQGIMSSPFKEGKGDVLKELAASCKKYDLKLGVYLSPADLYQIESKDGLYGNGSSYSNRTIPTQVKGRPFKNKTTFKFKVDDYNEYFLNQLFELLTEYGPIHEVWFDGANPKSKGNQKYNYLAWKELITTLAPKAVVFGKQDIRWCGNESGGTRASEWNIIPYQTNPKTMNSFSDITADDIGSREKLYAAKFLHYQQTEINTSIREGWFYRDDKNQKVRSVDDVFDIYERSVGGNATLLLNIPPNREGKFSPTDVQVLENVGKLIKETYSKDLLEDAKGPVEVLDEDEASYKLLTNSSITITTPEPITINRFVIQEAILTHSERIEKHVLEAWFVNDWKEIATATNVGYKRILRFQEVTSNKFRFRVLESRSQPAITKISAHYYKTRPPQLTIERDLNGMLHIQTKKHDFRWKPHGEDISKNINSGVEIRYTLDGSAPTKESELYNEPLFLKYGEVKAAVFTKNDTGSIASSVFGVVKKDWKLVDVDSEKRQHEAVKAFDSDTDSYWSSNTANTHHLSLDLGKENNLMGFSYTPQIENSKGMIESGILKISSNGKSWTVFEHFEFGNLINDPTKRTHYFKKAIKTRYIKIESTRIAGGNKNAAIAEIDFLVQ